LLTLGTPLVFSGCTRIDLALPSPRSQTRTVRSRLALTRRLPSAAKTTALTQFVCPLSPCAGVSSLGGSFFSGSLSFLSSFFGSFLSSSFLPVSFFSWAPAGPDSAVKANGRSAARHRQLNHLAKEDIIASSSRWDDVAGS